MTTPLPSSFRDPSGFLFERGGVLYRQINAEYREHFQRLTESGLLEELTQARLLVPHTDVTGQIAGSENAWKVIRPDRIGFISYPYEWSFSQLKDAALLTLEIQKRALARGLSLKDASAYNVQFGSDGRPILIDTLSFAAYQEGLPWVAYRQFCQHFLAPLALMSLRDVRLGRLLANWIDGIPLGLAASLLPRRSWLSFSLVTHIHLHAKVQDRYAGARKAPSSTPKLSKTGLCALLQNLESAVRHLEWTPGGTEWGHYYEATNYSAGAQESKKQFVERCVIQVNPAQVWDFGGNTGLFSRIASARAIQTMCFDVDPAAVEKNYRAVRSSREKNLLPLLLDLTNPSPSLGWANHERMSIGERGPAEMGFALALIHHLAISNNVPFARAAEYFASVCRWLVIEFVPKSDSQVQRLLASRADVFPDYDQSHFAAEFSRYFEIRSEAPVSASDRVLFLMERRQVAESR